LEKAERSNSLGKSGRGWKYNIKIYLQETLWGKAVGGDVDWIDVLQDRDKWRAVVHTVMNIPVPYNAKNFLAS